MTAIAPRPEGHIISVRRSGMPTDCEVDDANPTRSPLDAFEDGGEAKLIALRPYPHKIVYASSQWCSTFQWTLSEACGSNLLLIRPQKTDLDEISKAMMGQGSSHVSFIAKDKKGRSLNTKLNVMHITGDGDDALMCMTFEAHESDQYEVGIDASRNFTNSEGVHCNGSSVASSASTTRKSPRDDDEGDEDEDEDEDEDFSRQSVFSHDSFEAPSRSQSPARSEYSSSMRDIDDNDDDGGGDDDDYCASDDGLETDGEEGYDLGFLLGEV